MKKDIRPGQICIFDKYNTLGQKRVAIYYVSVLNPLPKKLFKKQMYTCITAETKEICNISENLLFPIMSDEEYNKLKSITVIRNPVNMPEINDNDILNLHNTIDTLSTVLNNNLVSNIATVDKEINELNKLLIKLNFYNRMISINGKEEGIDI